MRDYREINPKLHALYVGWAMEDLKIVNTAIENLCSVSRVNMSIMAGNLKAERDRCIINDAAWQEALIRLETNQEPPETDHETEHQEANKG